MNVSMGIDIGKKKCDYCVINGHGNVLDSGQYPNTAQHARGFAQKMARRYSKSGSCRAACETTANMWIMTYEAFESAGVEIQLASTFKMAIISKTAKKTDKVDAKKIAQVLRMGMIPKCYVPPAGVRAVRNMIRQRIRLVQDRTRVTNRVRSMPGARSESFYAAKLYSKKTLLRLESIRPAGDNDTKVPGQHIRHIRYLADEIAGIERDLESEAAADRNARLPAGMTGAGALAALLMSVEIADISRLGSPKKLVSLAGLCPAITQSGSRTYMTRIKKTGTSRMINWAMCEAANIAVQHDPGMAAVYEAARRRHAGSHSRAIIVVAHKMITIMWHILTTQTPYESRDEGLYQSKLAKMRKRLQE